MKKIILFLIPSIIATIQSSCMDPVGQRLEVNQKYVEAICSIAKQTKYHPIQLHNKITNLMKNDATWNMLLSDPFLAGRLVEQISKKNKSELYPVAIILNTPGTVAWLKKYIKHNPKKHKEIAEFVKEVQIKIKQSQERNSSKNYNSITNTLKRVEKYIF